MSRPLRIEYPGAWYHVMNRGRRKERVYLGRRDYQIFIDLLKEASELWTVDIASFCLMPNHYHMLIHTPKGNLSRFMRHVNGVYTQRFNNNYKTDGQLFRGRYKSIIVDGDDYLMQLVRYIHRNPLRAGLVKRIEEFEWSSHQGCISSSKKWDWLNKDFILSLFSDNKKKQLVMYAEYLEQDDKKETLKMLDGKKWPAFFGSDDFVLSMKERYYTAKRNREVPVSYDLSPDVDRIKEVVCKYYDIELSDLCVSKRRLFNEPRNVAIYVSRFFTNSTLEKLGKDFDLNSHSSTSTIITGVKKLKLKDKGFKKRLHEVEERCLKRQVKT